MRLPCPYCPKICIVDKVFADSYKAEYEPGSNETVVRMDWRAPREFKQPENNTQIGGIGRHIKNKHEDYFLRCLLPGEELEIPARPALYRYGSSTLDGELLAKKETKKESASV